MSFVVKNRTSVFVTKEATEGEYTAPDSIDQAIEVLEDFVGFDLTRETIERAVLSSTVEAEAPRAGLPDVNGSLPTEFKAGKDEGSAPRSDVLFESLLGGKREVVGEIELLEDSTESKLLHSEDDNDKFKPGDSILVKIPGKWQVRPIASVGDGEINLAIPLSEAPVEGVKIAPLTTYFFNENDASFSVTAELGGDISEQARGCKVESAELSNWTTGQIPNISFAIKALGLNKSETVSGLKPDFSQEPQPPVALNACAYLDGVDVSYSEFSLTMANELSDIPDICSPDGKAGTRNTRFVTNGSINPYMKQDNVERFQKFNKGDLLSLFIFIASPGENPGEIKNVAALWMPRITITSLTNGDQEGILTDEIEFQASKQVGNDTIFLSFI